ncbi:MAG TPA: PQQ-binding-like beta-propeller repeat protein [Bryobacteraceae bacterium]|jgi:quinoprotein glucose dehydrogenase|nr:PQQ-binding-like beta-propeller repeat protein [Bryobacteraceae bacterium]
MRKAGLFFIVIALLLGSLAFKHAAKPEKVEHKSWAASGGGSENIHYSTLNQITRKNVSRLQVAWTYDTGDAFKGSEMECNPIVVNGVLFATTPKQRVIALNAATGALKWSFDPNPGHKVLAKMRNRGVTFWEDGSSAGKRVFVVSHQYLYALDADTGKLIPGFADEGRLDLRFGLGRDPEQLFVSDTSPPMVYKDLVIVGSIVPETLPAAPGDIRAYDARSGKLRWSFHTIPHPGEFGFDTWPKDAWQYIGGVNNWSGMSLDTARGIVYAPLGSATFDFYGSNRLGDDLYANCLLALNAETGRRIWYYQTVHHDLWDRDLPTPPALVTVKRDGRSLDAAAQITKSGFVFLFDRETGKPLFPIESRRYPPSDVDGEVTAETQPLPTIPKPFARQILTADMLTTRTPEAHAAVLARFQKLRSAGQFVPPSREGTIIFPGFDGGGEWGGPAFDPQTGLLYVNANEMAWVLRLVPRESNAQAKTGKALYLNECAGCHRQDLAGSPPEFPSLQHIGDTLDENDVMTMMSQGSGRMPSFAHLGNQQLHAIMRYVVYREDVAVQAADTAPSPIDQKYRIDGYNKFLDPDGYPAVKPPWGTLNAINLNTGEYAWKIPFGEYPALAKEGMRNTGSENYGGGIITANGLVFIAATVYDKKIHAFDKSDGKLLWEATLPAAGNATPALYKVDGKEFLVIACGGGKSKDPSGGSYVAFALPSK